MDFYGRMCQIEFIKIAFLRVFILTGAVPFRDAPPSNKNKKKKKTKQNRKTKSENKKSITNPPCTDVSDKFDSIGFDSIWGKVDCWGRGHWCLNGYLYTYNWALDIDLIVTVQVTTGFSWRRCLDLWWRFNGFDWAGVGVCVVSCVRWFLWVSASGESQMSVNWPSPKTLHSTPDHFCSQRVYMCLNMTRTLRSGDGPFL